MGFYNNYIYSYYFVFKNKLFKPFISLECKCNKLQLGIKISSVEVSKQKLRIARSTAKLTAKKSIQEQLHFQERRDSVCFPVCIVVNAAFLSRRVSSNYSKSLEAKLLNGVADEYD